MPGVQQDGIRRSTGRRYLTGLYALMLAAGCVGVFWTPARLTVVLPPFPLIHLVYTGPWYEGAGSAHTRGGAFPTPYQRPHISVDNYTL